MDDYESKLKIAMLERQAVECDNHRTQCDADMDAHGKMLLQTDYRTTNVEKSVERLVTALEKYIALNDQSISSLKTDADDYKSFKLRINTTWKVTTSISVFVGGLIGFALKVLWGKS